MVPNSLFRFFRFLNLFILIFREIARPLGCAARPGQPPLCLSVPQSAAHRVAMADLISSLSLLSPCSPTAVRERDAQGPGTGASALSSPAASTREKERGMVGSTCTDALLPLCACAVKVVVAGETHAYEFPATSTVDHVKVHTPYTPYTPPVLAALLRGHGLWFVVELTPGVITCSMRSSSGLRLSRARSSMSTSWP
jgi:hypothetical protein